MLFAYHIQKRSLKADVRIARLLAALEQGGAQVYPLSNTLREGTDLLLSIGGDGTFLTSARRAAPAGVPVLGVNLGRMGFMADNKLEGLAPELLKGSWQIEERGMLQVQMENAPEEFCPYALNDVSVCRADAAVLGVDVKVSGKALPTYWADGLLVSTSTGSTAYSLSIGGPICTPDLRAFIIAPIAPHNINVRPLVVPQEKEIVLCPRDRHNYKVRLTIDNSNVLIPSGTVVTISQTPFTLKRAMIGQSNFIDALCSKLFWGEDVRNNR